MATFSVISTFPARSDFRITPLGFVSEIVSGPLRQAASCVPCLCGILITPRARMEPVMPKRYQMTWVPASRRWTKIHNGKAVLRFLPPARRPRDQGSVMASRQRMVGTQEGRRQSRPKMTASSAPPASAIWCRISPSSMTTPPRGSGSPARRRLLRQPEIAGRNHACGHGHAIARTHRQGPGRSVENAPARRLPVRPDERRPVRRLLPQHPRLSSIGSGRRPPSTPSTRPSWRGSSTTCRPRSEPRSIPRPTPIRC